MKTGDVVLGKDITPDLPVGTVFRSANLQKDRIVTAKGLWYSEWKENARKPAFFAEGYNGLIKDGKYTVVYVPGQPVKVGGIYKAERLEDLPTGSVVKLIHEGITYILTRSDVWDRGIKFKWVQTWDMFSINRPYLPAKTKDYEVIYINS